MIVYVVSAIGALALGLGVIAIGEFLRNKRDIIVPAEYSPPPLGKQELNAFGFGSLAEEYF